jgi:hypothetical protein
MAGTTVAASLACLSSFVSPITLEHSSTMCGIAGCLHTSGPALRDAVRGMMEQMPQRGFGLAQGPILPISADGLP